jgi:hypothetical protein
LPKHRRGSLHRRICAQDATAELQKLGGADVILSTVPDAAAVLKMIGGLMFEGKLLAAGVPIEPAPFTPCKRIFKLFANKIVIELCSGPQLSPSVHSRLLGWYGQRLRGHNRVRAKQQHKIYGANVPIRTRTRSIRVSQQGTVPERCGNAAVG